MAREAVTHFRELAQDNPDTYLSYLATSLSNLANFLSDVGQRQEALEIGPRGRHHPPAARPGRPRHLPPRPGHAR